MTKAMFDIAGSSAGALALLSIALWLVSHSRTEEGLRYGHHYGGIFLAFAAFGMCALSAALFMRLGVPDYRDSLLGLSPGRYVARATGAEFSVVARVGDNSPEVCVRIPGPLQPTFTVPLQAPVRTHEARAGS